MKKFRVAEIFGPTIQGEGRRVGTPCFFVRFGGCDYRCSWCDTPHAVIPSLVAQLPQMDEEEIVAEIDNLNRGRRANWIVLTGGNPALFDLNLLQHLLHTKGLNTMVETQGTVWSDWLLMCDDVCISPKPPSAGNMTGMVQVRDFLDHFKIKVQGIAPPYLKVVVFDLDDYIYARDIVAVFGKDFEIFLSAGNEDPSLPTVGNPNPTQTSVLLTQDIVLDKYKWLVEKCLADPSMRHVRVLPQLHVLLWANERGH